MMKIATVRFQNDYGKSKEYAYITSISDLEHGDLVVVEARDWYQIATFERYKTEDSMAQRHIIQKVDLEQATKDKELAVQIENTKSLIDERVRKVKEMEMLNELAAKDEMLNELLKQYKELTK